MPLRGVKGVLNVAALGSLFTEAPAGEDERQDDRRTSLRYRLGQYDEDPGADRGPDPEHRQLEQADRTTELAAFGVGGRLSDERLDRLPSEHTPPLGR